MTLPGFTAEASLAHPSEAYRVVRRCLDRDAPASVIPAMPREFCQNLLQACFVNDNEFACKLFFHLKCPD